jgi:Protein of unknown function (DUF1214)
MTSGSDAMGILGASSSRSRLTAAEARVLADEACVYGFAIVENYKAMFGMCVWEQSPQVIVGVQQVVAVDWKFIYTNSPQEALYSIANTDANGEPLPGTRKYLLRFPAGQLPPVDAFWSITIYHADTRLMVHNPINRYSIGDRTNGLAYSDDGSLTIAIQAIRRI